MSGHALLALAAIGYALWWLLSRWWWPFRPCPRCRRRGTNAGSNARRWGKCGRCDGSGTAMRWGAQALHKGAAYTWRRRRK